MKSEDVVIDFVAILEVLRQHRAQLIYGVLLACSAGFAYSKLAQNWYQAEVVIAPVESRNFGSISSSLGGISNLASLAGLGIPQGSDNEPLAVLHSRSLLAEFIKANGLLPLLFSEKSMFTLFRESILGGVQPDIRDGVNLFVEELRTISEDRRTGILTLKVKWTDPGIAADWANKMVNHANAKLRARALAESTSSIEYLKSQLQSAPEIGIQQAVGRLLENEMQKLVLARGTDEFAFRIVDEAVPPKRRHWPRLKIVLPLFVLIGVALHATAILAFIRRRKG